MDDPKVFPSTPVPAQTIPVSTVDGLALKGWVTQTLFWPLNAPVEQNYRNLKEGLSRTITEIPALAGRLRRASDKPGDLFIELEENAHVQFTYEDLSSKDEIPSYAALKQKGFPLTGLRAPTSPPVTLGTVLEYSPMIVAKLNQLERGLAMTLGFNHVLADGATATVIESIWAAHTKDVREGVSPQAHKPITPDDEIRKRLSTPPPGAGPLSSEIWHLAPAEETFWHLHKDTASFAKAVMKIQQEKMQYLASVGGKPEETNWCIWYFSPSSLADLKKTASENNSADDWISTGDALIGLVWSSLASLLKPSTKGHKTSTALFNMNIRSRLDPPIPNAYIGNVVASHMAECPLSSLEDPSTTSISAAAHTVRHSINSWTQSSWDSYLAALTTLPAGQVLGMNRALMLESHRVGVNDFSKFACNVNDWGEGLGVVDATRFPRLAAVHAGGAVVVYLYPRLSDGGLEVAVSMSERLRRALDGEERWKRWARFVCQHP